MQNKPILKGINLGGWLMMEGYILGGENIPETEFVNKLGQQQEQKQEKEFIWEFRKRFITEEDFKNIKKLGFNCVRLPFNWKIIEEKNGLDFLKEKVDQLAKHHIYVILDMHAVPGSQNKEWHSDSNGEDLFWQAEKYRKQYILLWKKLSDVFKNHPWIAAYDIMNEPVTDKPGLLKEVYQEAINVIRKNQDNTLIYIEGNDHGREINFLEDIKGENIGYSIHCYDPIDFTFNWDITSTYPNKKWNKERLRQHFQTYFDLGQKTNRPVFVGEFGVCSRCSHCGQEFEWVKDVLEIFEEFNFHWTYWTYKSFTGQHFPDGLYQCTDPEKILTHPLFEKGLARIPHALKENPEKLYALLDIRNFKENLFLGKILTKNLGPKKKFSPSAKL